MFMSILQHVPVFVWFLLAGLIALGLSMSVTQRRSLRAATTAPLAMIALSFYGVVSVFTQVGAVAGWAGGVALALALSAILQPWRGVRWSSRENCLVVPGSWVPLLLIMGLFAVKFGVNIALAMHRELSADFLFASLAGFAYGAFSGSFLSRGLAMVLAARRGMQRDVLA